MRQRTLMVNQDTEHTCVYHHPRSGKFRIRTTYHLFCSVVNHFQGSISRPMSVPQIAYLSFSSGAYPSFTKCSVLLVFLCICFVVKLLAMSLGLLNIDIMLSPCKLKKKIIQVVNNTQFWTGCKRHNHLEIQFLIQQSEYYQVMISKFEMVKEGSICQQATGGNYFWIYKKQIKAKRNAKPLSGAWTQMTRLSST